MNEMIENVGVVEVMEQTLEVVPVETLVPETVEVVKTVGKKLPVAGKVGIGVAVVAGAAAGIVGIYKLVKGKKKKLAEYNTGNEPIDSDYEEVEPNDNDFED